MKGKLYQIQIQQISDERGKHIHSACDKKRENIHNTERTTTTCYGWNHHHIHKAPKRAEYVAFIEEQMQNVKKYMQGCLDSLVVGEMQIKITIKYSLCSLDGQKFKEVITPISD